MTGAMHSGSVVSLREVNKWYGAIQVLRDVSLEVHAHERLVICGQSGSGKSTLLRCINGLEVHESGQIVVGGTTLDGPGSAEAIRQDVGMVFQSFNLFPHLTALENCTLAPIWVRRMPAAEAKETALSYLERVHLAARAAHYPSELSGGEQQRVSIARALVTKPKLLLADEPTGDLDNQTAEALFSLLESLHASYGLTSILVTHNMPLARRCDRVLRLAHGRVEEVSSLEV